MLRSFRNILKPLAKNCDLWNIHRFLFLRVRRYRFTENDFFKCRKLIPHMFIFWWPVIKAAQKVYFMHYSCRVIIWFDTGLYKSATSTYSFGKLVFCLSVLCFLSVLLWIRCHLYRLHSILCNHFSYSTKCSVIFFSLCKNYL